EVAGRVLLAARDGEAHAPRRPGRRRQGPRPTGGAGEPVDLEAVPVRRAGLEALGQHLAAPVRRRGRRADPRGHDPRELRVRRDGPRQLDRRAHRRGGEPGPEHDRGVGVHAGRDAAVPRAGRERVGGGAGPDQRRGRDPAEAGEPAAQQRPSVHVARRQPSADASPSSLALVISTGHGACRTTWSDTEPSSARFSPPRPRVPITMTSAPAWAAMSQMTRPGSPSSTWVRAWGPICCANPPTTDSASSCMDRRARSTSSGDRVVPAKPETWAPSARSTGSTTVTTTTSSTSPSTARPERAACEASGEPSVQTIAVRAIAGVSHARRGSAPMRETAVVGSHATRVGVRPAASAGEGDELSASEGAPGPDGSTRGGGGAARVHPAVDALGAYAWRL